MCNERGGVVDDLYVYRLAATEYLLIINASRINDDVAWLQKQLAAFPGRNSISLLNTSDQTGAAAVQGPRVAEVYQPMFSRCIPRGARRSHRLQDLKKNQVGRFDFPGTPVWVSRTGYTGEDGFEVVSPAEMIAAIWSKILAIGHQYCLQPAWTRRARYVAHGSLLSAVRPRTR